MKTTIEAPPQDPEPPETDDPHEAKRKWALTGAVWAAALVGWLAAVMVPPAAWVEWVAAWVEWEARLSVAV